SQLNYREIWKVIKMGNIKSLFSLLVGFIMAFLLGIAGYIAMFYINMLGTDSFTVRGFISLFTGVPLGSSLGIFITKMFLFRTGKFSVLCLFTSLVFGFLAVPLCPALAFIGLIRNEALAFNLIFPLVPLFALIGYNAMAVLLRRRKESDRSAPQKHLNDRDISPVIEKQSQ
ncbi:MAG: hypothetical protein ACE5NM_12125, partial [Sedimentisphaerales bacterium]